MIKKVDWNLVNTIKTMLSKHESKKDIDTPTYRIKVITRADGEKRYEAQVNGEAIGWVGGTEGHTQFYTGYECMEINMAKKLIDCHKKNIERENGMREISSEYIDYGNIEK